MYDSCLGAWSVVSERFFLIVFLPTWAPFRGKVSANSTRLIARRKDSVSQFCFEKDKVSSFLSCGFCSDRSQAFSALRVLLGYRVTTLSDPRDVKTQVARRAPRLKASMHVHFQRGSDSLSTSSSSHVIHFRHKHRISRCSAN